MNNDKNLQLPPDFELDDVIYQTAKSTTEKKSMFDTRNYIDTKIPKGQDKKEITIRLLPIDFKDGKPVMFKKVFFHNIPVADELNPNKSGKKGYMCLDSKNEAIDHSVYGNKCPICEAQQELWKQWREETDASKKKLILEAINPIDVREYCIIRCIERGKEDDGPKFWRIFLRIDKTDVYHKILLLAETRKKEGEEVGEKINILSCHNGRDLNITFTAGTSAPTVVDKGVSTPLTSDVELFNKWYYDSKKWSDVFSVKPYDYLKIAYNGEVPWFDKDNNCWVSKKGFDDKNNSLEEKINNEIKNAEENYQTFSTTTYASESSEVTMEENVDYNGGYYNNDDDDEELPF